MKQSNQMHTESRTLPNCNDGSARTAVEARFERAQTDPRPFPNVCIHELFEAQVEKTPDAVALIFEQEQLTYRQLNRRANQLAHYLRESGVGAETLVGVCLDRSIELIVALIAVLKAGGAYVPIDPTLPVDRLAFMLEDAQVSIALTQTHWVNVLPETTAKIVLDSDRSAIFDRSSLNPSHQTDATNLMYVIYTSGSTGKPKGVMVPHSGICNQLFWRQTTFELSDRDRVLQSIPVSFDPSVWQIFWPLAFGAQLVLIRPGGHRDSAYLAKTIADQQISVIALVPTMLRVLLEEKRLEQSRLKHVFCGGEALPSELIDRFYNQLPNSLLHNVYGPTEASIDATYWTCQPNCAASIAPIGCPIANAEIYILDSDLQPVEMGESGELHIGGAGLARGYLNRPQLTVEKFIPHPFQATARLYKSGDLARFLPDGTIQFLGRLDHQVKVRGFRIELQEIEATLNQHPSVRESVVVAREDRPGDKRLVAYIVLASGVAMAELRRFLAERLPAYMLPANFVELAALPLNPNGKVDRHALPIPTIERQIETSIIEPQDAIELELVQQWQRILNVGTISITDNFFELGGNSILAAQAIAQIEQKHRRAIPLMTFFQTPTIRQIAQILRGETSSAIGRSIVAIQPNGSKPPLFCVHSRGGNVLNYYPLASYLSDDQPVYGLQTPTSADGKLMPYRQIQAMAAGYIQDMQSVQPAGPYRLAGYSFGGLVAYEMARQLHDRGETVAFLALIDTYNKPTGWVKVPTRVRIAQQVEKVKQRGIRRTVSSLQRKLAVRVFSHNRGPAKLNPATAPFAPTVLLQDFDYLQTVYEQATRQYYPQPYTGEMTLFRAAQQPSTDKNGRMVSISADLGWRDLVPNLKIQDVASDHFSIIYEPELAQKLQAYLDQINSECLNPADALASHRS